VSATLAPRGGGPRSLGASLLDQVLAETLDPAYAQAAARRAAAAAPAGEPAVPSDRRERRLSRAVVALVMVVAGVLAAVTVDQAAAGARGREQVRQALLGDIDRERDTAGELGA
jgi:hypothetical protein